MNINQWFRKNYDDDEMHCWNRRACWLTDLHEIRDYLGYDESGYGCSFPPYEQEPLGELFYQSAYVDGVIPPERVAGILDRIKELLTEMKKRIGEALDPGGNVILEENDVKITENLIKAMSSAQDKGEPLTFSMK